MGWLIFDGISVLYVLALILLLFILLGIFARRQIVRLRNNSARSRPNITFPFSKRAVEDINNQLENVMNLRLSYQPRLTDCTSIAHHSTAPYVNRMIAVDEIVSEIDNQLARIDDSYSRLPGECTPDYLSRLRTKIPALPAPMCYRISFLHHSARFSPSKFETQHLMELRSLLTQFVRIINNEAPQPTPGRRPDTSTSSRRRRNKFGGSDGGRQLAGGAYEERIMLLPVAPSRSCDSPPPHQQRRYSFRNMLE